MAIKRIGDILIEERVITPEQLSQALKVKAKDERLGECLIRLGYVTESQVLSVLENTTGVQRISLAKYNLDETILALIDEEFARRNKVIPLKVEGQHLFVAVNDPLDFAVVEDLRVVTGYKPRVFTALKNEIDSAIEKYYGFNRTMEALGLKSKNGQVVNIETTGEDNTVVPDEADETPMVQLVNQILASAVFQRASDIHIDPLDNIVAVRYRIDGVLDTVREFPIRLHPQLVSRVKVMSGMDITEARIPQDGRIQTYINNKHVDLRISTLPTVRGEKIVMRILDIGGNTNKVNNIGLNARDEAVVRKVISAPNGIILVSGPTGSGKTTTLYACLNELNTPGVNIITVEDPVEIKVQGINQVQVQADVNMTFANALRAILRQDPNIVMIGEIRDGETAEIAVRASLTGHLVLSTIHTNDAVKTISRLVDMGIEPFMISSSLSCVISQRLVRRLCEECSYYDDPTVQERQVFDRYGIKVDKVKRPKGCPSCNNKGYFGRVGIFEVLVVNDELRQLITENASVMKLTDAARRGGCRTLIESGLEKCAMGLTTLEEVIKVTFD